MVLEELRALHPDQKIAEETVSHTGYRLNIGELKSHPHSDTLPVTRSQLLIVPLPVEQPFKHLSLRGGILLQTISIQIDI